MEDQGIRLRLHNGENGDAEEDTKSENIKDYNKYHKNKQLPTYIALIILFIGFLSFALAYMLHYHWLPTAVYIKDRATHPEQFVAERALNHLRQLSSFGSKPVGSYENEVLAVEFLTREIRYIMQQASPVQKISFDLQKCSGCYILDFSPHGFTNCYSQVQNIVVKLGANSSSSLLLNCHFDSVPTSPGTSDDGLNCAVMLEVLDVLARSNHTLKHNVIFLFNGAEESPLQASHGFISKHKWAHEVKAFINLEACGAGGREVLFQAGPNHPWLLKLYAESVPHPHAQVLAEDIFQSGLVPSDTDFRIFRDFGKIPGMDFAHAMNGYVYHTSYDSLHAIAIETLQHTGDNLLALTKHIASSEILSNYKEYAVGRTVFYDYMGLFLIRYSELTGIILNLATVLLSAYTIFLNIRVIKPGASNPELVKMLVVACGIPLLGWIVAGASVFLVAVFLDLINCSMSWFTRPFWIFNLYYCPVLLSCMVFPVLYNKLHTNKSLSTVWQARLFVNGVQLLWTVLLLIGTLLGIRSTFMFMLVVLFPTTTSFVITLSNLKENTKLWFLAYFSSTVPFTFFIMYHTVMAFGLFVPITGRIGSNRNPELIIGIFAALLCILSSSYITQAIAILRAPWQVLSTLAGVLVISILLVAVTPLGFPYSGNPSAPSPQRIHVYHTERIFHDVSGHVRYQDSGFWLVNLDRNSPSSVSSLIPEIAGAQTTESFCKKELVCGLPLFSVRVLQISQNTHWIPVASPPAVHHPTNLDLLAEEQVYESVRRLNFSVRGPDRMTVVLSPSVKLLNWSFAEEVTDTGDTWRNKPIYYINYAQGLTGDPFEFWIDLEVTRDVTIPVLDIAVIGHYINNQSEISEDFRNFLRKYPDWAHITAWPATYKSWKF